MKLVLALILATFVAFTNAGVGVLGPRELDEVMRLFFRHCGRSSEGGQEGQNTFIYCKNSLEPEIVRDAQHELVVTPRPEAARQVVFIQPPRYHYRHNIQIKGGSNQPQQTKIYVLPPQISHQVKYDDIRQGGAAPAKPQLFFLNNRPGGNQGGNALSLGSSTGASAVGFRSNDQSEQQQQQTVPNTFNNVNAASNDNNNIVHDNNAGFAANPQVQPASAENPAVNGQVNAASNFRPVRQYFVPNHPSLNYRG